MIINNFKEDVTRISGKTLTEIGLRMGIGQHYAYKMAKTYVDYAGMTQRYVDMVEALGYDIEFKYVKRMEHGTK